MSREGISSRALLFTSTLLVVATLVLIVARSIDEGTPSDLGASINAPGSASTSTLHEVSRLPVSNARSESSKVTSRPTDFTKKGGAPELPQQNISTDKLSSEQPKFAARYTGMNSQQLFAEGRVLNVALSQLSHETSGSLMGDKARWVDVTNGVNEEEWKGFMFRSIGNGQAMYRIKIELEDSPELYALRDEVEWLFSRSEELRPQ